MGTELIKVGVALVVVGGLAGYWVMAIRGAVRHERDVLKAHTRAGRARLTAVEAAEEEPCFSPELIEASAAGILSLAVGIWSRGNATVEDRPDAELIRAWSRSRYRFLGAGIEVVGRPSIDILGVANRGNDEDRVVLRVQVHLQVREPRVPGTGHRRHLDERWTLGRQGDRWLLLSVAGDPLAGPVLASRLIADPSSDTERLHEQSLAELADEQKVPEAVDLSGLVNPDDPPDLTLLDLSVVDSRFSPVLLAEDLQHIVETWEVAISGSEGPLAELTSAGARTVLLHPRENERLILRDVVFQAWWVVDLHLDRRPPAVEVVVSVEAVRYVLSDRGAVTGDTTRPHRMDLHWTLELTASTSTPWQLVDSDNPATSIGGWST